MDKEKTMNNKKLITFPLLLSFMLASCGTTYNYVDHLDDYIYAMQFHENFNILQLTDIHWNYDSSTLASKTYLKKVIKECDRHIKESQGENAKIDLIELTGDQFMLANTYHVHTFLAFFEEMANEYGFKYAPIWGNHDRHSLYNPNWLKEQFLNSPHCVYIEQDDDLYGRSNFVINLTSDGSKESECKWQIANLDSGASFSETAISAFRDYDYIRDDQVDWWLKEHEKVGNNVPTIAYYHIPQQDNLEAYNKIMNEGATYKNKFFKLENFGDNGNEQYASKFITEGRKNNLKAAFMGHAHNIDWTVDYDGVVIGLGVKTGSELYFAHIDPTDENEKVQRGLASTGLNEKFDLIGASLVTIKDENNFDLEHVYYNERETNDFVRWVKW